MPHLTSTIRLSAPVHSAPQSATGRKSGAVFGATLDNAQNLESLQCDPLTDSTPQEEGTYSDVRYNAKGSIP